MALFFKTENEYQGYIPDVLLPIKEVVKDLYWIITDIETYHGGTMFENGNNLCLTTNELLTLDSVEEIQLLWAAFSGVTEKPDNISDISIYNWHEYEDYYSNKPKLNNAIIDIVFNDASGYLVKSQDRRIYKMYMDYYKNCQLY